MPATLNLPADPGQFVKVIMNLVVNVRDAMPGGGKLTLETANVALAEFQAKSRVGVPPGIYVRLAVSDTRCGMDKETQSHLFEPFFTTKAKGKGTGLGLPTVYGIVRQSGGCIEVFSELGKGTTFKILLARVEEAAEPDGASRELKDVGEGFETILLGEDEEGVRALAGKILESDGHLVLMAVSPQEALEICQRHDGPIHLLLTDVVMPAMSGRQLAERLAPLRPEMRVLYVSGYTDEALVQHGISDQTTTFLPKPFTADSPTRKVRQVLDARR